MTTETEEIGYFSGITNAQEDSPLVMVLSKIPLGNMVAQAKAKKEAKSLFGLNAKQFQKLWRQAHPAAETEMVECDESLGDVLFQYNLNADVYVRMRADGIYVTNNKMDQDSGDRFVIESRIIPWSEFKVTGRYLVSFGDDANGSVPDPSMHQEWHYNIILDGMSYFDFTETQVKTTLQTKFTGNGGRDYLTAVLNKALNDTTFSPNITDQYRTVLGFAAKGWQLPDKYFFPLHDEISQRMYFALKKVLAAPWNKADVIQHIKTLYQHTGIEHKDILFAWAMYAPFSMALRDYYNLMVMMAMAGHGDKGKSPQAYCMTGKFYGHTDSNLGDSTFSSYSQCQSWMSSSTFPIVFDDSENLQGDVPHEIKSYTCSKSYMRKKGGGPTKQFYTVYKPFCANICMTFNKDPLAFVDSFFRERSVYAFITKLIVDPLWRASYNAVQDGDMLRLLYDYTKNWTIKELVTLVDSFDTEKLQTPRNKTIIRFLKFGAYLFEQILGIKLDLSELKTMIQLNNEINTFELVEAVRFLYRCGQYRPDEKFKPMSWILNPFRKAIFKEKEGYVFDLMNIRDIQQVVEGNTPKKWTYQMFFQKVCPSIFSTAEFTFVYAITYPVLDDDGKEIVGKEKVKGIFIPKEEMERLFEKTQVYKTPPPSDKLENAVHEDKLRTVIAHYEGFFLVEDIKGSTSGEGISEKEIEQMLVILLKEKKIVESKTDIGSVQYHLAAEVIAAGERR